MEIANLNWTQSYKLNSFLVIRNERKEEAVVNWEQYFAGIVDIFIQQNMSRQKEMTSDVK